MIRPSKVGRPRRWIAAALALALAGCANAATVQQVPAHAGVTRGFDASYDRVRAAALGGLKLLRLEPSSQSETAEGHVILVARPPHGFSWGEVGRIVVERSAAPPTIVRVVYERRMAFQFAGSQSSFARNLFHRMDQVLNGDAAGKAPTDSAPPAAP